MTSRSAGGQRFLATGDLMWLPNIARLLRSELGDDAKRVPSRSVPDVLVRIMGRRRPELEGVLSSLGRDNRHSTTKAEQLSAGADAQGPRRIWIAPEASSSIKPLSWLRTFVNAAATSLCN